MPSDGVACTFAGACSFDDSTRSLGGVEVSSTSGTSASLGWTLGGAVDDVDILLEEPLSTPGVNDHRKLYARFFSRIFRFGRFVGTIAAFAHEPSGGRVDHLQIQSEREALAERRQVCAYNVAFIPYHTLPETLAE